MWYPDSPREYRQKGAVWPTGQALNDTRRVPSLTCSDGSLSMMPGPTGLDLRVRPWINISTSVDGGDVLVYIEGNFIDWNYQATRAEQTFRYTIPDDEATVQFYHLPWYWIDPDGDTVSQVPSFVWCCGGGDTIVGDATAEKYRVNYYVRTNQANSLAALIGDVRIGTNGSAVISSDHGIRYDPYPDDIDLTRYPRRTPYPIFWASPHTTIVKYDASTATNGTLTIGAASLAIPPSTAYPTNLYVYGTPGGPLDSLVLTAVPGGKWGYQWGKIATEADQRIVVLTSLNPHWWFEWPGAGPNTSQGYTGTQDVVTAVNFLAETVTTKTVTVVNGLITSIA